MMHLVLIFLVASSSWLLTTNAQLQPSNCNLFQGCQCTLKSNSRYDILCLSSTTLRSPFPLRNNQSLIQSTAVQQGIQFFEIMNYNFVRVPPRSLQNLSIESLFLSNNNMENITKDAFETVASLRYLNIYENRLNIEPDTFSSINMLEELSLTGQITDEKLELMRADLMKIKNLRSLALANNNITNFDNRFTQFLGELQTLDLSSNSIRYFSAEAFRNLTKLQMLILSFNPLNDSNHLINNVLRPVQRNIVQLFLKSNQIDTLGDMTGFVLLQRLDMSFNRIVRLNNRFENMTSLRDLNLASNRLEDFDTRVGNMRTLQTLDMRNNILARFPNVTEMSDLRSLNLMGNRLSMIPNFAFERMMFNEKFSVDLRSNPITSFQPKAFCSRNRRPSLNRMQVSFTNIRNFDKCQIKQLSDLNDNTKMFSFEIDGMDNSTNELCRCEFKEFANRFRVRLSGNCLFFNNDAACLGNRTLLVDDCNSKPIYLCDNNIFTETSTGTVPVVVPSKANTKMASPLSLNVLFGFTFFMYFI